MATEQELRNHIATAKRVVVKIGTSSLVDDDFSVSQDRIDRIVDALQDRMAAGSDVIVVSSGAIAAGMAPLGLTTRPRDLATKQAAAAVGQVHLAQSWGRSFARYGRTTGQVLLTQADAGRRERARNAQRTIDKLRQFGAVPIVNENDTVATSEMRFGDNDRLSAIVSTLVWADALYLLSDVDGLYDRNPVDPAARKITQVRSGKDLEGTSIGGGGALGTGGMAAKVSAARLATRGGVPVLLASSDNISRALTSADCGTVFHTRPSSSLSAWKFWVLYAADAEGVLHLDAGAVDAVTSGGTSLLAVGITGVDGEFHAGDIVEILGPGGETVGRGEVAYGAAELADMIGKQTSELPEHQHRPVIRADYLSNYATRL
ncbi:glutamate 5-kinase [Corynebacterium liangguodongii]|uniref:Glutamate 5-kinase n=1 Tax=Corynebacterium liangguodongii TaxID=2079535 RepID=A0A2S0WFE7_9CORY|nr:glutamate 5-kinase [Corynebacterium liangguodongii]AWB84507.1 glutamate 5-kinase [Corynebacterium liangguodongii]PWB98725.1 glutamate 5-kinase [Corynebacterium liangguodongii]